MQNDPNFGGKLGLFDEKIYLKLEVFAQANTNTDGGIKSLSTLICGSTINSFNREKKQVHMNKLYISIFVFQKKNVVKEKIGDDVNI